MPLDPQMQAVLERAAKSGLPPYHSLSAAEARRMYKETRAALSPPVPEVAEARDLSAAGPAGPIALRLYRGADTAAGAPLPALMYFHGGGWTIGDLDTHDIICRTLANKAHCAVVAVDYRMGPEHRFPAAVDDCLAATRWVARAGRIARDRRRAHRCRRGQCRRQSCRSGGDHAARRGRAAPGVPGADVSRPPTSAWTRPRMRASPKATCSRATICSGSATTTSSPADYDDWRASPLRAADLDAPAAGARHHRRLRSAVRRRARLFRPAARRRGAGAVRMLRRHGARLSHHGGRRRRRQPRAVPPRSEPGAGVQAACAASD